MKMLCHIVLLFVFLLLLPTTAGAAPPASEVRSFDSATLDRIERSLAMALESESPGMQASAALTLRQVRERVPGREFGRCVIPLMRIVKTERCDATSRICAALALHELRSARGDFAISRTGLFTRCPKLRHLCLWLSYYSALEGR